MTIRYSWTSYVLFSAVYLRSLIIASATVLIIGPPAHAAEYFFDSRSGSDTNSGATKDEAWKTFKPLKTINLKPGDGVNFRCGSEWIGNDRPGGPVITASGAKNKPITLRSYGEGDKPVFGTPSWMKWGTWLTIEAD